MLKIIFSSSMALSIQIMLTIAIFISYGLQGYVPVEIIWKNYIGPRYENTNNAVLAELILRICCVIVTGKYFICTNIEKQN